VTVAQAAQLGRTSPEARQTWLVVVLVSAQVVPLAFRQASLEQGKQLAPIWLVVQRTSLEVVLAQPVWLAVQEISPEVARAEPVWSQVVPLAFPQVLPEQD
jgi:hypothetical protein